MAPTSRRTCSAPSAPAPTYPRKWGWHPNDWQFAHFYDPRYMDPKSLMPDMKSLFSDEQVEQLVAFVQERSGKSGLLRYAGQLYAKHVVLVNQGFPLPYRGFKGAHKPIVEANEKGLKPPSSQLEEAPNLSQIDRSYWLSGDPLPVTQQNLMRGKEVFLERCVGCHGLAGDGKGPGANFLSPPPADFTDKDDACCGGDTGPGDFYYRILRGWSGTAMENFGDRLSVNDIWRVVLFVKTIPNGTLKPNRVPEPRDYIVWQPSKELLERGSRHTSGWPTTPTSTRRWPRTPTSRRRCSVFPGLAPSDSMQLNDGKTQLSLQTAAAGIKALYDDMLNRAWSEARARGENLPDPAQKLVPPDGAGRAMRRFAGAVTVLAALALVLPAARVRARPAGDEPVALGDGRLDDGHLLHLLGPRGARVRGGLEGGPLPGPRPAGELAAVRRRRGLLHARLGARRRGVDR